MKYQKRKDRVIGLCRKWLPKRSRRQLLLLLAVHFLSFYGGKLLNGNGARLNMSLPVDELIPVIPWTFVIYIGCFVFWAVNYTLSVTTEPEGSYRFLRAEILGKIVSFLFFVIMPSTLSRPQVTGNGLFPFLMRTVYAVDTPECLFPSMHCFVSWMCVLGLRGKTQIPGWYRIFSAVFAVLVFASTLTTKQHVLVDVLAGFALAELMWLISGLTEKRVKVLRRKRREK